MNRDAHCYRGYAATNPDQFQDVSGRVLDFQWEEQANETSTARLLLDNADNALAGALGTTLRAGTTLSVRAGYATSSGVELAPMADLTLQAVTLLPDRTVRLEAVDASGQARRRVLQTWSYSDRSVRGLLAEA